MAQVKDMVQGATAPSLKIKLEEQNANGEWVALQGLAGATVAFTMIEPVTHVDATSASGQKVLYLKDTEDIAASDYLIVGFGTKRQEVVQVHSVADGVSITAKANLTYTHLVDDADEVAVRKLNGATAVLESADDAILRYDWGATDLNETGLFVCQFKITTAGTKYIYAPTRDQDMLYVQVKGAY